MWLGKQEGFDTEGEAVTARDAYRAANVEAKKTSRALHAQNLTTYGQGSTQERNVAVAFVAACHKIGLPAFVLNDGTKADVLLGLSAENADAWVPVQIRTTQSAQKTGNAWRFFHVTGYSGMAVVCWRCDIADGWVYDGGELDELGVNGLNITPNGKNCKRALARHLNLDQLVQWLRTHADQWPPVTEHAARHNFASQLDAIEMQGMDKFRMRFPEHECYYPEDQNSHVDLIHDKKRLQLKTVSATPNSCAGFVWSVWQSEAPARAAWAS